MRLTTCLRVAPFIMILVLCSSRCGAQQTAKTAREHAPLEPRILSAEEVFKQVSPSIFIVQSLDASKRPIEQGSAVVIGKGLLETNYHVIKDGATFEIFQGSKKWQAELAATNPEHDLAELKVEKLAAPDVRIRPSSSLSIGEQVYAIGAPEGLELTISQGLISGLRRVADGLTIQTSAAISPGSSGGGLFDSEGRLVGITTAYLKEGENLNFALPAEWALSLRAERINPGIRRSGQSVSGDARSQSFDLLELASDEDIRGEHGKALRSYQQAADLLKKELGLVPDDEVAWAALGLVYDALRQYDNAVSAYREAIRLKPDDEHAWEQLGEAYGSLGQYQKSVDAEQAAVRFEPDDEDGWKFLGEAYDALGSHEKAVATYKEAIRLKPNDESPWESLGEAYFGLRQYNEAANIERKALDLDPKDESAWQILGAAYDNLRQYKAAVDSETTALSLKPKDALAWYNLGIAYSGLGEQPEVIRVHQKLKTLDPKEADEFFKEYVLPK